ncbi:MAG: hypothetical protein FWD97_04825 [Defluviitaleaceae bacterium]|nr:hypothetical protein [Defluviitaleaceae bacterium]
MTEILADNLNKLRGDKSIKAYFQYLIGKEEKNLEDKLGGAVSLSSFEKFFNTLKTSNPSLKSLNAIASAVGWSVGDLLTEGGKKPPDKPLEALIKYLATHDGRKYAVDNKRHKNYLDLLFGKNQKEQQLNIISLSVANKDEIQRGTVKFTRNEDIIQVDAEAIHKDDDKEVKITYKGFALILPKVSSSQNPLPMCWVFAHRIGYGRDISTTAFIIDDEEDGIMMANHLSLAIDKNKPATFRMILSEKYIPDEHLHFYAGHLKQNRGSIVISEPIYEATKKFLENTSELNCAEKVLVEGIEKYFCSSQHSNIFSILDAMDISDSKIQNGLVRFSLNANATSPEKGSTNLGKVSSTHDGRLLYSWLRSKCISNNNNSVSAHLNKDLKELQQSLNIDKTV